MSYSERTLTKFIKRTYIIDDIRDNFINIGTSAENFKRDLGQVPARAILDEVIQRDDGSFSFIFKDEIEIE